jgi:allantoin racemase
MSDKGEAMRICFLGSEERRAILQSFASPGTQVERLLDFTPSVKRPATIESAYDEYLSVPHTLQLVVEAARRGYEAVVTGCFGDPGIDAARELVSIPVIGPGEACLHTASMLGGLFSIITVEEGMIRASREQVHKAGLDYHLASIVGLGAGVMEIRKAEDSLYRRLLALAQRCLKEDGADVVVIGCASMSYSFADRLGSDLPVPVLHAPRVALRMAEMLVGAGLSHSKKAYPAPPNLGSEVMI